MASGQSCGPGPTTPRSPSPEAPSLSKAEGPGAIRVPFSMYKRVGRELSLAALLMRYAVWAHIPVGFLALPAKRTFTPVHLSSPHRGWLVIPVVFWVRMHSLPYPMVSIVFPASLRRRLSAARHIAVITVHLLSFSTDEQKGAYRALHERQSKTAPFGAVLLLIPERFQNCGRC